MTKISHTPELERIPEAVIVDSADRYMQLLRELEKAQDDCHLMLAQMSDQRKEIDRLNEVALKRSIEFENLKLKVETSNMHLFKMLDEKECEFERTKCFESPQICIDYIDAALYCKNYFGRESRFIQEAKDWYNDQPVAPSLFDSFRNLSL